MNIKLFGIGLCAALGLISPVQAQPLFTTRIINMNSDAIAPVTLDRQGMNTSAGSGYGKEASAWAVSQIIQLAVNSQIGENPNSVASIHQALKAGQGLPISDRSQAIPGDIVIAAQDGHIGICLNAGCTKVVSNLASEAKFSWLTDADFNDLSSRGKSAIYRMVDLALLYF